MTGGSGNCQTMNYYWEQWHLIYNFNFFDRINRIRRITIHIQQFLLAEAKLSEILKIL